MTTRRIILAKSERFSLWGRTVATLKVGGNGCITWTDLVACRDSRGEYIGSVTPEQVPEVANALASRGRLA